MINTECSLETRKTVLVPDIRENKVRTATAPGATALPRTPDGGERDPPKEKGGIIELAIKRDCHLGSRWRSGPKN